jgi:predicted kinase
VSAARLIVITGRPGTGKTTLSKAMAEVLPSAYLRIDAIETALQTARDDLREIGPEGYVVAHYLARSNLELGRDVIVDAVCPVPEARTAWAATAAACDARLIIFQTSLTDEREHARRVGERLPDLEGQRVPRWSEVIDSEWMPWVEARDGRRCLIDTTSRAEALASALGHVNAE